jgi:hypothetical protein
MLTPRLKPTGLALLKIIHSTPHGEIPRSEFVAQTGRCERAIIYQLRKLEKAKIIQIDRRASGRGYVPIYHITPQGMKHLELQ